MSLRERNITSIYVWTLYTWQYYKNQFRNLSSTYTHSEIYRRNNDQQKILKNSIKQTIGQLGCVELPLGKGRKGNDNKFCNCELPRVVLSVLHEFSDSIVGVLEYTKFGLKMCIIEL